MNEFNDVYEVLSFLQANLVAPKNQLNKFGGYKYRSCEDILEATKKVMPKNAVLLLNDDIKMVGDRFYLSADAILVYKGVSVKSSAFAREALTKKGMDDSQITGSTSSYARKYALNGLLCIDDSKDADDDSGKQPTKPLSSISSAVQRKPESTNTHAKVNVGSDVPIEVKAKIAKEEIERFYKMADQLAAYDLTKGFSKELKKETAKLLSKDVLEWLTALSKNPPPDNRVINKNYGAA